MAAMDDRGSTWLKRFQALIILSVAITIYSIGMLFLLAEMPEGWEVRRYLVVKSINGFVSTCALLWVIEFAQWLTPGDWLEKISENPIACAVLYGILVYTVGTIWIYG